MTPAQLEEGYWWAYDQFYRWPSIIRAAAVKPTVNRKLRHVAYSAGWKKLEPLWSLLVTPRRKPRMLPALESVLSGWATVEPASLESRPESATPSTTPVSIR